MSAALAPSAAAAAVEDLAHGRYETQNTPVVAFMGLALCGARHVVVAASSERDVISAAEAVHLLDVAPFNVSWLVIDESVPLSAFRRIVTALSNNPCHSIMRRLDVSSERPIAAVDATALLAATNGLAHLRWLRCAGAGVSPIVDVVGGSLRRLAVTATADLEFGRLRLLRRIGPVCYLRDTVALIDLSHLQHLVQIDDYFGLNCDGLRAVRLPPSVTAIGKEFLNCASLTSVLDLSALTLLRSIGSDFATYSSITDLRLPSSLTSIGAEFLHSCKCFASVLDLSKLTLLRSIGEHFAAFSSIPDLRLPSSITSIGAEFVKSCKSFTAVLDLSELCVLRSIGDYFAAHSNVPEVRLPSSVALIGHSFLLYAQFAAVLDLSNLTRLRCVKDGFAKHSALTELRLPPSVTSIGAEFLHSCKCFATTLNLTSLSQLRSVGYGFARDSSLPDLQLPPSVTSFGASFLVGCSAMSVLRKTEFLQLGEAR
jgi:hypothetical protein